ncbi:uncharacterized protein LOC141849266 [Brevipalpus obovatus]|uniref:uncharacterized protein LOC141849266 n=1 Tax=Brevipalpus obovatus TaxID=246614 RepID=UPI003D9E51DB
METQLLTLRQRREMIPTVFSIILVNVLMSILETFAKDGLKLSDHQFDRICKKVNKLKVLGQSDSEIEEFLTKEMSNMIHNVHRSISEHTIKGYGYSDDWDDGQIVDLRSKNKVGPNSQLNEIKQIGTDASTGSHSFDLNQFETNNDFKSSDISYFTATVYVSLGGGTKKVNTGNSVNSLQSRLAKENGKLGLSNDECNQMIQAVYNQAIQNSKPIESESAQVELEEKAASSPQRSHNYHGNNNSTNIETQFGMAPNSFAYYLLHQARGEATLTDRATVTDTQNHGNIKESKVTLTNILIPTSTTG